MDAQSQPAANWGIIGHEWAVDYLRRSLRHGRNRHAYLITGPAAVGKMTLALRFAMALNCEAEAVERKPCGVCDSCRRFIDGNFQSIGETNEPDVIIAQDYVKQRTRRDTSSGRLSIDDIRLLIETTKSGSAWLYLKPYNSRYRIALYERFHLVLGPAQDALLKSFEEPPPAVIQILTSDSPAAILPTIRSRAQIIALRPVPKAPIKAELRRRGADDDHAELLARLSNGRVGWALGALEDDAKLQYWQSALDQLDDVLAGSLLQRLKIAEKLGSIKWVTETGEATEAGQRVSQRVALYNLLEIWQSFWRDVLLETYDSPLKPCNINRRAEIRRLARSMDRAAALRAIIATRRAMNSIDQNRNTNANPRLVLDALFLDYPVLK